MSLLPHLGQVCEFFISAPFDSGGPPRTGPATRPGPPGPAPGGAGWGNVPCRSPIPAAVKPNGKGNGYRGQHHSHHQGSPGLEANVGPAALLNGGDAPGAGAHQKDDEEHRQPPLFYAEPEHHGQSDVQDAHGHAHGQQDDGDGGTLHIAEPDDRQDGLKDKGGRRRDGHGDPAEEILAQHHVPGGIRHHGSHLVPAAPLVIGQGGVGQHRGIHHGKGAVKRAGDAGEHQN